MKKIFLAALFALSAAGSYAFGETTGFADYLFKQQDYYRAIGEYKRQIYEMTKGMEPKPGSRQQQKADSINYRIGLCYIKAGKYDDAMSWFKEMEERFTGYKRSVIVYNQALGMSLSGDYGASESELRLMDAAAEKNKPNDNINYLAAWNYIYEGEWEKAEKAMLGIRDGIFAGSASGIAGYMQKTGFPEEKPVLPGVVMSAVVPGTGYFYCNRFFDGLLSMAVNALFITNTALSIKNRSAAGWAWGAASALSYSANLYGTANAVMLYNRAKAEKYAGQLEIYKADLFIYEF